MLPYTSAREPVDDWKRPLKSYCGSTLPPGAKGYGVRSLGPDGIDGTADDITSWQ
ncbi:MAG: type II secretion system protein GspG [Myxococcota bacterium]|nr:type II secretion system protein GspG [Myxococcota bacterium]